MLKLTFTLTIILGVIFFVICSFADEEWVGWWSNEPEGTPPIITILECDENHTLIDYQVPGMWLETVTIPSGTYDRISLPDYATTFDIGYPEIPVIRNLVAVPVDGNVQVSVVSEETIVLEDYDIYPYQPPPPMGQEFNFFNYDTEFYKSKGWYPDGDPSVSTNGKWRQIEVVNLAVEPMRYDSATKELEVAHHMVINVSYDQGPSGDGWIYDELEINTKWKEIFRTLIINYDSLGITEVPTVSSDILYIILCKSQYLESCNEYADWIELFHGYSTYVEFYDGGDADYLHERIKTLNKQAEGYGLNLDYVLLVGVPSPYIDVSIAVFYPDLFAYCDQYLACVHDDPDYWQDLAIGRMCTDGWTSEVRLQRLQWQFTKNQIYTRTLNIGGWQGKSLLVAHYVDGVADYPGICNKISEHDYTWIDPNFIKVYGTEEPGGPDNSNISCNINNGVATVLYTGHGKIDLWENWTKYFSSNPGGGEYWSWTWENIRDDLTNSPKYPVVFNICCHNARWMGIAGFYHESLVEEWVIDPNGAVAAFGSSNLYFYSVADRIGFNVFRGIYDFENGPNKGFGAILQWSVNEMIKTLGFDEGHAMHDFRCTTLFGDPAMIVKVSQPTGIVESSKNNDKYVSSVESIYCYSLATAFPNPVTDFSTINFSLAEEGHVTIKLFDISGRLVDVLIDDFLKAGEYQTTVSGSELNSGVYITSMESNNFSSTKNIVVVK